MSRSGGVLAAILFLGAACSPGEPGGSTGAAGTGATGAAGTSAGPGAAGTTPPTGSAGTTPVTGAAGTSAAGGSVGSSGTAGNVGSTGAAGTGQAAGSAGSSGGNPDGGAAGATAGTGGGADAGARGNKVLLYTRATGFVHGSTKIAAAELARKGMVLGLVPEISDDPAKFEPAALAQYAGVVLIASSGEPFGSPGTTQVKALIDWVRAGGGLVGIENCNNSYVNTTDYIALIGGRFNGHGAGMDTCTKDGIHPTTKNLPDSFQLNDEWYNFTQFRMDNLVVLRCTSNMRPISWVRDEGSGRVFYTALGHYDQEWTTPPLVDGHVLPGLLWSMGRPVP